MKPRPGARFETTQLPIREAGRWTEVRAMKNRIVGEELAREFLWEQIDCSTWFSGIADEECTAIIVAAVLAPYVACRCRCLLQSE